MAWAWVDEQLRTAPVYWVTAGNDGHPHPRPVWGVWLDDAVWLSIGSPTLNAGARAGAAFTVHLESGTEPVIVEGTVDDTEQDQSEAIAAYNAKYDWTYDVAEYGALIRIEPTAVIA